jgi:prolyl-tRNA editing enzyme YbaK/EbsC (Cys-tRNA(Pro) deacylase)
MNGETLDLADFMLKPDLDVEIVAPGSDMPTVDTAAEEVGVTAGQIFKSILFQARDGQSVMVATCGNGRVDLARVKTIMDCRD